MLIFAVDTGVSLLAGYIISGTFTNQIQVTFRKPCLLVVTDPRADNYVLRGLLYPPTYHVLYNTDYPLCSEDLAVPRHRKGAHSVHLMRWMLDRKALRMCGTITPEDL